MHNIIEIALTEPFRGNYRQLDAARAINPADSQRIFKHRPIL